MRKGIVTSCGSSNIHFLNLNILLKFINNWNLPVEIFHQNEIEFYKINYIKKKYSNVSFINLNFVKDNLKGYQIKPFAMYFSTFEELLWIDNDIVPIISFEFLFNSEYDAIFWKDRYTHSSEIIKKKYNFEYEYETGVIFIRKNKVLNNLIKVIQMNSNYEIIFLNDNLKIGRFNGNRNKYYQELLGDKDTFQIGFKDYDNKYINSEKPDSVGSKFFIYQIPYTNIIIKFPFSKGNYYETGLIQKYKNNDLFLHKTVYENKLGEIFYYLYDIRYNENYSNSQLSIIEDVSKNINKEVVSNRYYYYIIYFLLYVINCIFNFY